MGGIWTYYDVGEPVEKITELIDRGDSISYDLKANGVLYTIKINKVHGNHYEGEQITKPGGEKAVLEGDVYRYKDKTIIFGKRWEYPDKSNYLWLVEFENGSNDPA